MAYGELMQCVTPLPNNTGLRGRHKDMTRETNDPGDTSEAGREEQRHAVTEKKTIKARGKKMKR